MADEAGRQEFTLGFVDFIDFFLSRGNLMNFLMGAHCCVAPSFCSGSGFDIYCLLMVGFR